MSEKREALAGFGGIQAQYQFDCFPCQTHGTDLLCDRACFKYLDESSTTSINDPSSIYIIETILSWRNSHDWSIALVQLDIHKLEIAAPDFIEIP